MGGRSFFITSGGFGHGLMHIKQSVDDYQWANLKINSNCMVAKKLVK